MVFCNRCGEKTETVITYPKLDLWLCKDCGNSFHSWLTMTVHVLKDKPQPDVIEKATSSPEPHVVPVTLLRAQNILRDEGYIYYKKPESWGQKQKRPRIRRTRKEIELARQNEEGSK